MSDLRIESFQNAQVER